MDKRYGIRIVSVTIFVLWFVGTASAGTWYVDDDGGADFTGIQNAIDNASDGDTIIVHSGVYYENVVVGKSVTLKGIEYPIVDAGGEGNAIRLTADGITLVGFNVTNSGNSISEAGIAVTSNNNIITGNNVSNNNGDGIELYYSCNNTITGNNVSNNHLDGISLYYFSSSNNNTITGNNVCNNNCSGIGLWDSCNNTITGNNVSNNYHGISLSAYSNNNTITGNVFVNDGLPVYSFFQNTVEDNTVNGKPLVYLEDASDIEVIDAGQVILVNCNNITIENLDLSNTSGGIALWKTENSKISQLQATMSATTAGVASSSGIPATTQLQATMSPTTTVKASASSIPATTKSTSTTS
jgi:parallel beta-helix repeat protein